MRRLEQEEFVCVDLEMTGLDLEKDRIIEVAVCKFTFSKVLESYETLVDPQMPIPEETQKIHHISDEMVHGKPTIASVLPQVIKAIGTHMVIGHGVGFDLQHLQKSCVRTGIQANLHTLPFIDTLRLARLYGDSPSNALKTLGVHFNVPSDGAHRAMSDVLLNIEVFKHLARKYKTVESLQEVLSKPILMKTMPLGKHKGRLIKDIPLHYLEWIAGKDFDQDLLFSIRTEIKKRKQGARFEQAANPFHGL